MSGRALGPGATVGILGTGVPRLACLRPTAWLKQWPSTACLHQPKLKTLARGQASRGERCKTTLGTALPCRLARRRRDQGRAPREEPVMQAMTIEARRAPACAVSLFLFGAKGASTGQGIKQRLLYRCNETKTSRAAGPRSPRSPRRRHRQCLWQSKTNFSQDNLY